MKSEKTVSVVNNCVFWCWLLSVVCSLYW